MKDFKVAEIVPVDQLEDIASNHYHMCLAHLVAMGCNNKQAMKYTEFYRRMSDEGKFVLMDNGAAEGSQLNYDRLFRQYEEIRPSEIVVPDTLNDANDTLAKMFSWLGQFIGLPYRFMAVPQGKTFEEWKACAYIMMQEKRINTIGISKFLNIATGDETIRHQAVQYLDEIADKLGRDDIEYHLLGCDEGPGIVGGIQSISKRVRGCDSAFAYIASKAEVVIERNTKRPAGTIDFLNDTRLDGFIPNSFSFEGICGVLSNTNGKEWK